MKKYTREYVEEQIRYYKDKLAEDNNNYFYEGGLKYWQEQLDKINGGK